MELGEPPRDGVARELEEETGLTADPDDLTYVMAEAGEPAPNQHMVGIDYAIHRTDTTGPLQAASDATDTQFVTPSDFHASDHTLKHTHVDRFGDDLHRLHELATNALDDDP
jgi:8-oxo-dGTP diphosphatase